MAGTAAAVLEHTWNYKVFSARVGELEVGEFGVAALLAGESGVPALYLSGDDKAAEEARALVPGIVTTVVKTGVRREAAAFCVPDEARARMRADVEAALRARRQARAARLERRAAAPHLHPRDVLRPRRDVPGHEAARRAHAGDRRRDVRRGLRERSSPACGSRRQRARACAARRRQPRPRRLRPRRRCGQISASSGCGAAGSTSASQAEDRGFESRHPLHFLPARPRPCRAARRVTLG